MFERYDEPARRVLFYARYAASDLRSRSIEGTHLLLGLIREQNGHAARVLSALRLPDLRKELEAGRPAGPAVPVSVEIPFSPETKRMLEHAVEEADRLADRAISTVHLLLGLMREEESVAAAALGRHGLRLDEAREQMRGLSNAAPSGSASDAAAQSLLQQLSETAAQLRQLFSRHEEASMRIDLLQMDLETLKAMLNQRR